MRSRSVPFVLASVAIVPGLDTSASHGSGMACGRRTTVERPSVVATPATQPSADAAVVAPKAPEPPTPRELLRAWLAARIPSGGSIEEDGPELAITHTVQKGETLDGIAAAYLDVTSAYWKGELQSSIARANPNVKVSAGAALRIPKVVQTAQGPTGAIKLGWPSEDRGALRGIYVTQTMAANLAFPNVLDKMAARGMNAVVFDAKDVTGYLTYPTKIPLALETRADKHPSVASLPRFVRAAHARGIRVISRITCFRDEWIGPRKQDLAIRARGGGAHRNARGIVDWLDPSNETVQNYLLAIVDEVAEAGVDEIQLDYVRYPTEGVGDADFKLKERGLSTAQVITDFVAKVHARTQAAAIPLSLDVFGVVAWRHPPDMAATGQDLRMLAPHIEALSPMVYPSHFAEGFNGFANPGDHAEVVAIGTKRAIDEIKAAGAEVVVRSWVQAFPWRTTTFGAPYVAAQIEQARIAGGVGWLAWNSGGEYGATFAAVPLTSAKTIATK
jgi:hypothetical protein